MVLAMAGTATAHFVFIVPDKGGSTVKIVFSDGLEPDEAVPMPKVDAKKLMVETKTKEGAGVCVDLEAFEKGEHCYNAKVPGKGHRVVHGTVTYGVRTKGKEKKESYLVVYHPYAVIGKSKKAMEANPEVAVQLVPVHEDGKLRLMVTAKGKPVADAEVTVLLPGDKKKTKKVTTDKKGLTEAFEDAGRYGAWVRHNEAKSGEHDGKKYDEVHHYATLVVELPK